MESAEERRARLKALREEAQAQEPAAQNGHSAEPPQASAPQATAQEKPERKHKRPRGATEESAPVLKFRNYAVRDDKIEHTVLEPAKPPEFKPQEVAAVFDSKPEDLIASMTDKKANQDLRRDVEKALAKLERRTQRALVQIAQSQAIESEV